MNASLNEKLGTVKWGEFKYKEVFNRIEQGRRLKKDDQIDGTIPFVMSGTTNAGVVNYISNPVASFPKNAITIDIFGNTFYRNYAFGAGDDTGVYWNDATAYSSNAMLFFAVAMQKSMMGRFSYGKKLRSSQSEDFTMHLPVTDDGAIDFDFMESFMFGSAKYRNYKYGADDHVAVVHTEAVPMKAAIFVTSACHKAAHTGKFDYGHNFYAKDADALDIQLPTKDGKPDYDTMTALISAVQKLVIKDVVLYADRKIEKAKTITKH